jgi:hypothetical protein
VTRSKEDGAGGWGTSGRGTGLGGGMGVEPVAGGGAMGSEEREYPSSITKCMTPSMGSGIGYRLG